MLVKLLKPPVAGLAMVVIAGLAGVAQAPARASEREELVPDTIVRDLERRTTQVAATGAWVRPMPISGRNTGAYVELENTGPEADALIAVETGAAEVAELHEMTVVDEMMRMRQVERIELPAGETVVLEPGGLHIMLIRLTRPLEEGATIEITLRFASGTEQTLGFLARVPEARQGGRDVTGT